MPQATIGVLPSARVLSAVIFITLALTSHTGHLVQVLPTSPTPVLLELETAHGSRRFGSVHGTPAAQLLPSFPATLARYCQFIHRLIHCLQAATGAQGPGGTISRAFCLQSGCQCQFPSPISYVVCMPSRASKGSQRSATSSAVSGACTPRGAGVHQEPALPCSDASGQHRPPQPAE